MPDVGVSELFRFRTVRSILHKDASSTAYVVPDTNVLPALLELSTVLAGFDWMQGVSTKMALSADYLTPQQVIALLPQDWQAQVAQRDNNGNLVIEEVRKTLHAHIIALGTQCRAEPKGAYGVSVVPPKLAAQVEEYCRALLVLDLIVVLAPGPRPVQFAWNPQTAQDVQTALTFRNVVLPNFNPNPPVLARQPGFTDLYIVKDEWNRYDAGELANVVNVLPGETLDEKTNHLDETDTTTSTSSQQTTTLTTTNSQTTSQTLSQASTTTASTSIGAHAQVEIQAGWGPMQINSNIGAQIQTSQSSSQSTSRTTATQIVNSAVKIVSQTVIQSQTTRTKSRDTDFREHKLENTTAAPTVGLYRWLSVVHRCQTVVYPHRFVLEFEIPEPGYWLRWALTTQPDTPWSNPNPGPFTIDGQPLASDNSNAISPGRITQQLAHALAARWRIQGLPQEPVKQLILGQSYSIPQSPQPNSPQVSDNSISVPDGYEADTWAMSAEAIMGANSNTINTDVFVAVGTGYTQYPEVNPNPTPYDFFVGVGKQPAAVGAVNTGTIPVAINGFQTSGGVVSIVITCKQQQADNNGNGIPYLQWQQSTFDQIVSAYNTLLSNYNQERVQRAQQQTGPIIVGPPDLNLARCVMELKKAVIQDLLGARLTPQSIWQFPQPPPPPPPLPGYGPFFNPPDTAASAPVVQFFEQAFEWENLVYICYPYFWGGQPTWVQNATGVSTSPSDPVFDQFLDAGSARVVVPARPGFENLVSYFLYTGQVWGGQKPPGPNDPDYLSVADEIEALQTGATDGTPIDPPWEVTLPTTYLWAGTDPNTLPVNPAPTIPAPP